MTIELIEGTLDTASVSKIASEVLRWMTFDPDVIEHVRATTPTWRDWIGLLDGSRSVSVAAASAPGWKRAAQSLHRCVCFRQPATEVSEGRCIAASPSMPASSVGSSWSCSRSPTIRTAMVSPHDTDSPS